MGVPVFDVSDCWSDSEVKLCVVVGVEADGTDVGKVGRLKFGFEVIGSVNKKHKRNKYTLIQRNEQTDTSFFLSGNSPSVTVTSNSCDWD